MPNGPTDFCMISAEDYAALDGVDRSLAELKACAKNHGKCDCGMPVWRLANTGLCFSCTTGEADASEDYELIEEFEHADSDA